MAVAVEYAKPRAKTTFFFYIVSVKVHLRTDDVAAAIFIMLLMLLVVVVHCRSNGILKGQHTRKMPSLNKISPVPTFDDLNVKCIYIYTVAENNKIE